MARDRTARTRIRHYLATAGPVVDPSGYATGVLKDAIDYSGSSVAFIQLIAAMERDNEIERDIRGKRTYRISGVRSSTDGYTTPGLPPSPGNAAETITVRVPGQPEVTVDYQKLARALVAEFMRTVTENAQSAPRPVPDEADERVRVAAERDDYARRLEIARQKLDEILGGPATDSRVSSVSAAKHD